MITSSFSKDSDTSAGCFFYVCVVADASLAFDMEDLESEEHHRLRSGVDGVVAVGVVGVVGGIVGRNHSTGGGREVCSAP